MLLIRVWCVVEGCVYSWGSQVCGQLGYEVTNEEEAADELEDWGENQPHYSAGEEEDATDEEESAEKQPRPVFVQRRPKRVLMFGPQRRIIKLAVGNHFVLALSESAHVFSWGRNTEGQLGLGDTVTRSEPSRIEALTSYVAMSVSAGHSHALGIFCERREQPQSTYHVVLGWGRSLNGCLGLGGSQPELEPRENLFFRGLQPSQTAAGTDHSLVLCSVGSATYLYAFGGNRFGQLGVGSHEDHLDMPWLVDELMHRRVVSIGAGARYSTALTGTFSWQIFTSAVTLTCAIPPRGRHDLGLGSRHVREDSAQLREAEHDVRALASRRVCVTIHDAVVHWRSPHTRSLPQRYHRLAFKCRCP